MRERSASRASSPSSAQPALTIQEMPNLSVSEPNVAPQNCFSYGIWMAPSAASASKMRRASSTSGSAIEIEARVIEPDPRSLASKATSWKPGPWRVACMMRSAMPGGMSVPGGASPISTSTRSSRRRRKRRATAPRCRCRRRKDTVQRALPLFRASRLPFRRGN